MRGKEMPCLQDPGDCLREQMQYMMRSLQDLRQLRKSCPVARSPLAPISAQLPALLRRSGAVRACQQRGLQREQRAHRGLSDAGSASTYDSACSLVSPLEEEEDEEKEEDSFSSQLGLSLRLSLASPSSRKSLEFDSGYSEASCPVMTTQTKVPFFHQSLSGINQLDADFYHFAALMKSGSRQPIICKDIISYI
uniref:Uncharacterized protein n=1 Tax=Tetraodon nigroviridis TaxID=99883 RepID=H3DAU9_TETNG